MQVSVIIVNYNVKYFLEQCLLSVERATAGITAEIIVVDNHSTDQSIDWLGPKFPGVRFIANNENIGFARANNVALTQCAGEYVLFLNPDTLVPEDVLEKCIAYMAGHPKAGALGIRMIDGRGRFLPESKRSFPRPIPSFFKLMGAAALFPNSALFNKYALGNLNQFESREVPVLAGAGMFVRKEILDRLNGFDESYFMYGEDIDLSYRIQQLGFENHYFAGTTILHFKGKSSRRESFAYIKNFYGAMLIFVRKHYAGDAAKAFSFLIWPAIVFRGAVSAVRRLFMPAARSTKQSLDAPTTVIVVSEKGYERIMVQLRDGLPVKEIIFYAGELPTSLVLIYMQRLSGSKTRFLFHVKGSSSIIGSDATSLRGRVFSLNFNAIA